MKKLIVLLFLVIATIACSKKKSSDLEPVEKTSCPAARTVSEGTKRIVGIWKLATAESGWANDYNPEDQRLVFKADGTCTVITKDSTYAPVKYSVKMLDQVVNTPVSVSGSALALVAGDTIRAGREYYLVNKSILILCQDKMILDYGLGIYADAAVLTYRREIK